MFEDKIVLVTGGTGSFGHQIVKELLKYKVKEIRIYSRGEDKQYRMRSEFPQQNIKFIIGDVRDYNRLLESTDNVDIIYHAAALKQVHLIEKHPLEAIKTNIYGTINVKRAAIENGVKKTILISTDKAVKPINAYGMTKALAEKVLINNEFLNDSKFSVVRYGNVIGSTGSVIPLFKKLVNEKKTLTITDKRMTRFLITLKQAINLVLYCTENMRGQEIFVPKLPACKIIDLAKIIGGEKYPIKTIGIRPGEKIHECLVQEDEMRRAVSVEGNFIIGPYGSYSNLEGEFTSANTLRLNKKQLRELIEKSGCL